MLIAEKSAFEKSLYNVKRQLETCEVKNKGLETELKLAKKEIKQLMQELEEYKDLGLNFRKMADELAKQKQQEISSLKEELEKVNNKLNVSQKENDLLSASKKQLEQIIGVLRSADYEVKIDALEQKLARSEEERKDLEDLIQKLEKRSQSPLKNQTPKV